MPKPARYDDLLGVSLCCDSQSCQRVLDAYNAQLAGSADRLVQYLNPLLELPEIQQWTGQLSVWKALAAHISRELCGNFLRPISLDEAALVPRIGMRFIIETSLGLLTARNGDLIFFRMSAARHANLGPAFSSPDSRIDLDCAKRSLTSAGWAVVSLS